jgi:hypothetical protein
MSEIGSDPDDLNIGSGAPGNQPDDSFTNLYPASPQPGLIGGQFASQQASAPMGMAGVDAAALGVNPDISGDGTGLPPSLTVAPNLPQLASSPLVNASPSVDYGFISRNEGQQQLKAYPSGALANPAPATGKDKGANIGVTIATGVDLGSHSVADLKRWGVSDAGIANLTPAMGLKGDAARTFLNNNDATISAVDAQAMDQGALNDTISAVQKAYDAANPAAPFSNLTLGQQTAIIDLAYQYGTNLSKNTPNFWGDVTSGNWNAAMNELNHFGDAYSTRRKSEAAFMQGTGGTGN